MRRFALLGYLCVCLTCAALGLDPHKPISQYVHKVWQSDDGLPQNSAQAMLQTNDGYVWIGTQEGLVRFNGVEFKVFNKSTTDAIRDVRVLYQDREGALWIGTFGGGLVRYQNGQFTNYTANSGLSNNSISCILQDRQGNLWVGTENGLNEFTGGKIVIFNRTNGLSDNRVRAIAEDREGKLVVAGRNGLDMIANGVPMGPYSPRILSRKLIQALFLDNGGSLWIGKENYGLDVLNAGKLTHYGAKQGLPNSPVHAIYQDRLHTIWVATEGAGICRLASGRFDCYGPENGLSGGYVESIFEDREGSLWVGTETGGINFFREALTNYGSEMGLQGSPRTLVEDPDGSLWIGTTAGLWRMKDYEVTPYLTDKGPANNYVYAMARDHLGNIWVGTGEGGLNKFTGHTVKTYRKADGLEDGWILAVLEDRAGDIWVGTCAGVRRLHKGKFTNYGTREGLSSNRVWAIHQDYKGNLWFGTDAGLSLFVNGKFINHDLQAASHEGPGMGSVSVIYEDAAHVLWVGTFGGGLKRFQDGKFASITMGQGLFQDTIWSIREDDLGNFWMSSSHGIFRAKRSELMAVADGTLSQLESQSYGVTDGMESSECNGGSQYSSWKTKDGKLLFACLKSVVVVDPEHLPHNPLQPPVVIESVTINQNENVAPGASVLAGAGELDFHYAALSYLAPRKVTFQYKLEGFEDNWATPSTPGLAHYTNIPPGSYTFHVKAANNDGMWNETGASFSFYLAPRFYQTQWFNSLCALVLVLSLVGIYLFRLRQVRMRERELVVLVGRRTRELQVAKELAEAATRSKSEFLANVSHEIRTPLNGVTGMLDLIDNSELTIEQKQMVALAQDSASTLMVVINDILDFSRIEAGKLAFDVREFSLADTVAEAARAMTLRAHQKGLELAYQLDAAVPRFLMGDAHRIKQVLVNLLGNAVKFTEKGEVVLRVAEESRTQEEVCLRFSVSDTGIGIAVEKQRLIFEAFSQGDASTTRKYGGSGLGLAISSRIVELMGGKIWVVSKLREGATFYFTAKLPIAPRVAEPELAVQPDLAGIRVLVVDDNATSRVILEEALKSWGLVVRVAGSGPEALCLLQQAAMGENPYHLLLADHCMPGMDGLSLVMEMRKSLRLHLATVMMLTADDYYASVRRCREMGIAAYLLKPVTLSELVTAIRQALSPVAEEVQQPSNDGKLSWRSLRILLAEDNSVNQRMSVRMLEKMGHLVAVAQTGKEALDALRTGKFDLVLMDLQMPEMDGFAATREIRTAELDRQDHVPVIAMTAHAMKGDREECLAAGMDDYLAKPINSEELRQVIERVMTARKEPVIIQR
ncbi:MAG TPA: two-component regulator propeller domain-containing protein [Candidatus Angelobacter sp.]|nr:two-component regulator propeller domain-containing protein [Candidatus Angelobacter sp.]